jgi:phosphotriesterase-related protein
MTTYVETVRGPVDTDRLGPTLMHEHVFTLSTEIAVNYPELAWSGDKATRIEEAVAKLAALKARGVDTLVDLTVLGLGRDVATVAEINAQVDINIVVATGLYTYDELPGAIECRRPGTRVWPSSRDLLVDLFVADITEGIVDTGVKAGILKCCTEAQGLTPGVERVLRAVARAHRETGVPISTHTNAGARTGLDQQKVFAEEGVDLSRVVIGHSGDTTDLDYLRQLMDDGSVIGMDRCGIYRRTMPTFEERVATIAALAAEGYADRMVLSHDASCHLDLLPWFEPERFPKWHYTHISDEVLPALREQGVTEEQTDLMMIGNPRRVFSTLSAY